VLVLGVQGVSQPLIDAGVAVARPGDDEAGIDATFVGWHPAFALGDIEAACRVAWAGAPLYTASSAPFFATRGGKTLGISGVICAAIRSVTRQRVTVLGKPSLVALRVAARRLGVAPERLVVIGDDPRLEIAMARAAGACAVGVTTGLAGRDVFGALPPEQSAHLVVDGIAELLPHFRAL
jgi:NagD protein